MIETKTLAGISRLECPKDCDVNGCVITCGRPICGHPAMAGLPNNLLNDLAVQEMYAAACQILGVRNIHATPTGEAA